MIQLYSTVIQRSIQFARVACSIINVSMSRLVNLLKLNKLQINIFQTFEAAESFQTFEAAEILYVIVRIPYMVSTPQFQHIDYSI